MHESGTNDPLVNLLGILLILILGDAESPALVPVALSLAILIPGASYLSGWMTAHSAPNLALQAVTIAAVTGGALSLADKSFWVVVNVTDSPLAFRVTLVFAAGTGAARRSGNRRGTNRQPGRPRASVTYFDFLLTYPYNLCSIIPEVILWHEIFPVAIFRR